MMKVSAQERGRIRVVLAVFDRGMNLGAALIHLAEVRVEPAQLGIAARATMFSRLKSQYIAGALAAASAPQLVCGAVPLGLTAAHEPVHISAGPLWAELACFGSSLGEPLVTASWMAPQLRVELEQHLARGAVLLGVRAGSADQLKATTQILLNHSSHRVHTHDFRL